MCDPVTITMLAITGVQAAQSVSSYVGAKKQANQQNAYYEANKENAITGANAQMQDLGASQAEQQTKASGDTLQVERQANTARSTAAVAADDAGISGHSVDALISDLSGQEASSIARIDLNSNQAVDQLQREKTGVLNNAQSRIDSVQQANQPSILQPILGVAAGVLQGVTYKNARTPNRTGIPTIPSQNPFSMMPEADNG